MPSTDEVREDIERDADAIREALGASAAPHYDGQPVPPFFGGTVAKFWPDPYGPEGTDSYTIAEARDAITRAFWMARTANEYPADEVPAGAAGGYNTVSWAACDRQDLLLFACGSVLSGLAQLIGQQDGTAHGSIPLDMQDLASAPDVGKLVTPATALGHARALRAEAEAEAGEGNAAGLARMRSLALLCARQAGVCLDRLGQLCGVPPLMLADLCLASIPYAFPVTAQCDAADHSASPPGEETTTRRPPEFGSAL